MKLDQMGKQAVPVNSLLVGHYISLPMGWTNHPFMRSSFKIKNAEQLAVIRTLGLAEIDVIEAKSDVAIPPSIDEPIVTQKVVEKPQLSEQELWAQDQREKQKRANKAFEQTAAKFRAALLKFNSKPEEAYFSIFEQVNSTLQKLYKHQGQLSVFITLEPASDDDIFHHSVNVAVLSCLLAKQLGLDEKQNQTLCLGAMVHDIGEMKVPTQIRKKPKAWESAEQNFYQTHPKFSLDVVRKAGSFPDEILPLVLDHHEHLDGSGYPNGKTEKQLHPLSQLLTVVDTFEHLCHPLPSQKRYTPQEAFAMLYKQAGTKYNKSYVETLMTVLGIFPPGAYVELNDGRYGMVMSSNPKDKLTPNVLVFESGKDFSNAPLLELAKETVRISKTVSLDQVPAKLLKNFDMRMRQCFFFDPV